MSEQFWVCSDTLSEHFKKVISGTAHVGNKDSHNGIISIPIMGIAYTHDGN